MDLCEAVYALETTARTISEPFSDGEIFQAAPRAGKSLCAHGAGKHWVNMRPDPTVCQRVALPPSNDHRSILLPGLFFCGLSKAHAGAAAVLVDELDASQF
jgi:hypothetical protein